MLRVRPVVVLMLALAGCQQTAELGSIPSAGVTTETSVSSASETTTVSDGGSESESTGSDGSSETGVDLCAIDGTETPCDVCLEHLCCMQLEACGEDNSCFCMLDCLAMFDAVECAMNCTPGTPYFELVQCRATSCASVCE